MKQLIAMAVLMSFVSTASAVNFRSSEDNQPRFKDGQTEAQKQGPRPISCRNFLSVSITPNYGGTATMAAVCKGTNEIWFNTRSGNEQWQGWTLVPPVYSETSPE
ncbi:MAG: hypothetical protein RSD49_06470 [Hafnia sp.]